MLNSSDTTCTADELRADERAPAMYHSVSIAAQLRDEAVPPASHNHIVFGALCTPPVDLSLHQSSSAPHVLRYRLPKSVFPPSSGWQSPITPGGELARSGRLFSAADNVTGSNMVAIPDKQVDVDLSISPYRDSKTASLSTVSETGGVPTGDVLIPGERSCYEDSSSIAADAGTGRCFDARSSEEVKSLHSSYPMQSISVADRYPPEPPASCLPQPEKKPAVCSTNVRPARPNHSTKKRLRKGLKLKIVRQDNVWRPRSPVPRAGEGFQQARPVQPGGDGGAACKQRLRQLKQHQQLLQHTDAPNNASVEEFACPKGTTSAVVSEGGSVVASEVDIQQAAPADSWHGSSQGRPALITPTALPGFQPVPVIASTHSSGDTELSKPSAQEDSLPAPVDGTTTRESEPHIVGAAGSASTTEETCDVVSSGRGSFRGPAAVTAHVLLAPEVTQLLQVGKTGQTDAPAETPDGCGSLLGGDNAMETREEADVCPRLITLLNHRNSERTTDDGAGKMGEFVQLARPECFCGISSFFIVLCHSF